MTPLEVVAVVGPLLSVGAAVAAAVMSFRVGKTNAQVAQMAVTVSEKQAHTAEVDMILSGYAESHTALRGDYSACRSELKETRDALDALTAKYDELVDLVERQRAEMVRHVVALEELIPTPPGPPARPTWSLSR